MRTLRYALMATQVRLANRENAVLHALADLVATLIGLVVIATIYRHVPEVRGWTAREALLAWGFSEAEMGVFFVVFYGLFAMNPQYIVGGDLDRVLRRPLDPYLQVLLDHVRPLAGGVIVVGLGVIAYAASSSTVAYGAWWLLLPVFVCSGALVVAGLLTGLVAIGFFLHHQGTAIGLGYQMTTFARYPSDWFSRPIAVLILVVPFAFAGFVPATFFMERPEWWGLAAVQPLVGMASMAAGYAFFRVCVRTYSSSGT